MRLLDPRRLVFVDECETSLSLAPLRARAKGERAFGKASRSRGKNTTLLASIMGPCPAFEGGTRALVFEAYNVQRALGPFALARG